MTEGYGNPSSLHALGFAAHSRAMAIHIFGGGMGYNIRSPLDRTAVYRRWKCIIHNQRNAMSMGSIGKPLNIQYRKRRIGYGLVMAWRIHQVA